MSASLGFEPDPSPAWTWLRSAASLGVDPDHAVGIVRDAMAQLTPREQAAIAYDFRGFWARSKQRIRPGAWRSYGFLAGRGWGKTVGNVAWIVERVLDGRVRRLNLIGPTDDQAYVVGFEDPFAGLRAWSPPWCRPEYRASKGGGIITWPNGAECRIFGAYKPDTIRGGGVDVLWCTELQSWQASTAVSAWNIATIKTREGRGEEGSRILWDATSGRRNSLIADRIRESLAAPERYVLVTGDTRENEALDAAYLADLLDRHTAKDEHGRPVLDENGQPKLTRTGEEEIRASYSLDTSGALWRAAWIRKRACGRLVRRVISVDPAFSAEKGSDAVGISDAGLDEYGQLAVLGDHSAVLRWEAWGDIAIDLYLAGRCDCLVVERNKAGDAVAANIRARVLARNFRARETALRSRTPAPPEIKVVVLERDAPAPSHDPTTIYVREINARSSKWNRAEPVANLYEAGLAYHDASADLRMLETTLTSWEPTPGVESPNAMDALTQAAHELIDLLGDAPPKASVAGIAAVQREAARRVAASASTSLRDVKARGWIGGRI